MSKAPAEAIRRSPDDHDVDLVVMVPPGRTGLNRWPVGSVVERAVRLAPMPVLTVRPADAS